MDKKTLKRELEGKMKSVPWTYRFGKDGKIVNFTNVRTETLDEEDFLESLREEGAEEVIEGTGGIYYKIARSDEKLWLSLVDENMKEAREPNEINEHKALEVFREAKREKASSSGIFSIFGGDSGERKREMAPNRLKVRYKLIEKIDLDAERRNKLVKISGEDFKITLRGDGGVDLESGK